MEDLTLDERALFYRQEWPQYPASWASVFTHATTKRRWLTAHWIMGNNYRAGSTSLYGAYPPGYLPRMAAFFPDAASTLHLFAGSLQRPPRAHRWVSLDRMLDDQRRPLVQADAAHLPFAPASFDLCYADPPYSAADAEHYGSGMPDRRKVLRELHTVMQPGGMVVWLDTVLPMYRKADWDWVGVINVVRSSNHRVRNAFLFQRAEPSVG